jgi:hypothetical protein
MFVHLNHRVIAMVRYPLRRAALSAGIVDIPISDNSDNSDNFVFK